MESAYATIEIGGRVRRADIDQLAAAMEEDYCHVDGTGDSGEDGLREEIIDAHNEGRPISLYGEDVPYAEFDSIEALCRRLGLTFKRCSDPIFDSGKTLCFWKPGIGEPLNFDAVDGEPVMTVAKVRSLIAHGELADVMEELDEIIRFKYPLELQGSGEEDPTPAEASAAAQEYLNKPLDY